MASFIRRLFGGREEPAPAPSPAPAKAAAPAPTTGQAEAAASQAQAKVVERTYRTKTRQKTVFTSALGLSERDKSGIALKTLTGQ